MKRFLLAIAFTAATPLLAQSGGCVAVAVGSEQKGAGRFDATFATTEIIDLDFSVLFTPGAAKRFANDHVVEFRITTPHGNLYQSVTIPFSSDDSKKGRKVTVPGYPDPIATVVPTAVTYGKGQHVRVAVRMPVAGTPIVWSSLYGQWTAQAFVDGEAIPCSKPATFTLTP